MTVNSFCGRDVRVVGIAVVIVVVEIGSLYRALAVLASHLEMPASAC